MATETFYPKPEFFENRIQGGKGKRRGKLLCPDCERGVLWSVPQPRIRWGLNQETYQCDKCKGLHVVQGEA